MIYLHAKYLGWRSAAFLSLLPYACKVAAGVTVHLVFAALGHLPTARPSLSDTVRFEIDYTFWLNVVFALIGGALLLLHFRGRPGAEQPAGRRERRMARQP